VVQLLIDMGADFSATREDRQIVLHRTLFMGHEGVARMLIDRGTDFSATNKDGQTLLHLASSGYHEGVAQLLIDRGTNDQEQEESKSELEL
jgi:ankyrin repeat protein